VEPVPKRKRGISLLTLYISYVRFGKLEIALGGS